MDYQIKQRGTNSTTHYPYSTEDAYGDKTFAAGVELPCFVEEKISIVKKAGGEEYNSSLRLYFDGLLPISAKDEFIYGGIRYPVLNYSKFKGLEPGTGTTVVYL